MSNVIRFKTGQLTKNQKERLEKSLINLILILGSIVTITPFLWMIGTSLDLSANMQLPFPPRFIPPKITFRNFVIGFNNVSMFRYYLNTITVTVWAVVIAVLSALMAGYAFSKMEFKFKRSLFLLVLATLMVPFEMVAIPMWRMFRMFHLLNTYWALIIPYLSYVTGTFFAKQFFDTIPDSLKDSAFIDGANEFRIFIGIFLPLAKSLIATLTIFVFIGSWNSFLWPLIAITDPEKYTIQIGIALFTANQDNVYAGVVMAISVIAITPVVVMFMFFQRYIVGSIALSGLKQ